MKQRLQIIDPITLRDKALALIKIKGTNISAEYTHH